MEIESGDCKHVMDDRDLKRERRGSIETEVSQQNNPSMFSNRLVPLFKIE
jgi:hypothetical protein